MSYSSILTAERIAMGLSKKLGGDPKDYLEIDFTTKEVFVYDKPKKYIWTEARYPRWFLLKQLEKK